jgi:peroxiredoxin
MKKTTMLLSALLVAGGAAAIAAAQALVGQPAPDFTASDTNGKPETLSSFKGKWVVLEWTNAECPFVQKHYNSGNMQRLQKTYTGKGVTWLSINSSAPGKEGWVDAAGANALTTRRGATPTAFLLDPAGTVGRLYGAKATPHMFVIDPSGKIVYQGAIDDKPSTDLADVKTATNYVSGALDEAMAGKAVTKTSSQPYGCSVKY